MVLVVVVDDDVAMVWLVLGFGCACVGWVGGGEAREVGGN